MFRLVIVWIDNRPISGYSMVRMRLKQVSLAIMKDQFSKYLRMAFETEGDWLDYRLENDPRFLQRIAAARQSLLTSSGVSIEELSVEE